MKITLKDVRLEKKGESIKPVGTYAVMLGDKEVAKQAFNDGYSGMEVSFSRDVRAKINEVEMLIDKEIKEHLGA